MDNLLDVNWKEITKQEEAYVSHESSAEDNVKEIKNTIDDIDYMILIACVMIRDSYNVSRIGVIAYTAKHLINSLPTDLYGIARIIGDYSGKLFLFLPYVNNRKIKIYFSRAPINEKVLYCINSSIKDPGALQSYIKASGWKRDPDFIEKLKGLAL